MNREKIIRMLEYCGMSYRNDQPHDDYYKIVAINDKKIDIQCFLRFKNDELIIAFRGSDSKKDWKADFKFWKTVVPYNNFSSKIRVHSGFIGTYKSKTVRNKIHKFITENIKKICVTGHSYGAALAVLCAVDLEFNFPDKDYEVILFGCPRVGNKFFRNSYNLRLFKTLRIEAHKDIVPLVPFAFLGYRHVGAKIKIAPKKFWKMHSLKNHTLQEYYSHIWDV